METSHNCMVLEVRIIEGLLKITPEADTER